jgi:exosortase B
MSALLEQRLFAGRAAAGPLRWLPVALGLAVMYLPTYVDLAHGLWQEEAHAHGPIILVVVAWLVWRQRAALAGEGGRRAPLAGGVLRGSGLLLYAVGRSQGIALFEVGSHIPVLAGALLLLRGWAALRKLWFALFFLVFLVPLPGFVIAYLTGPLKSLIAQLVDSLLYGLGYPIARSGVVLSVGQYQMMVADACSGLNSIFSLAALGLLYLYLTASRDLRRSALLLASILPIAFVTNLIRVLVLILVTFHFGEEAGQSFFHGSAGMALFALALVLLLGFDALLRRLPPLRRSEAPA